MKIISVDTARTTWLFPVTELNPGGLSLTKAFRGLAERYDFKKFPKHSLDADPESKGLVFSEGTFKTKDGRELLLKFTIFSDGILADTWSSTKDSEDFLKDAMKWIKAEYGLGVPADRKVKTLYLSQLTVTTDGRLAAINPKLQQIADLIADDIGDRWASNTGFNVGGITFWPNDPTSSIAPVSFIFEMKVGTRTSDKRYYTRAAVQTETHLQILDKLENLFG